MPKSGSIDEKELLSRIARDDEEAFAHLFDNYWKKVYTIALTYLKSASGAEDATQEVFIKFWMARGKVEGLDSLDNYLFIMTRNEVLSRMRKKVPQFIPAEQEENIRDTTPLQDKQITYKEIRQQLHTAIDQLPPQQQMALRLSREEGLSHEEIAARMNLSKNTVKNYIVKGLNTIRIYLQEHGGPLAIIALAVYADFFKKN